MNVIKSKLLSTRSGIEHGFSVGAADIRELVDCPPCVVFKTKQVHGNTVHILDGESADDVLSGDAFITSKPGVVCHIRTADCVPVLIADTKRRTVGAVHAGWKGTSLDIVGETMKRMCDAFSTDPADCVVAVGPSICGECYEVGEEIVDELSRLGLECDWRIDDRYVDLGAANYELIKRAGVPSENIDVISHCTSCDPRFVSWRRERSKGRQVSFISLI